MRRVLCWLGFHRFTPGRIKYGTVITCLECHGHFLTYRSGATDDLALRRVEEVQ